jgi:Leucine-rich repeat (LRR) protein
LGWTLWPEYKFCGVTNKDFTLSDIDVSITFSGSFQWKQSTTAVQFFESTHIEFIPLAIFNEFPNINGFMIDASNLPILKTGLFTTEFKVIEYLYLGSNEIETIESDAFINMIDLKWINLSSNQIGMIESDIFKKNNKLEFIGLQSNLIKMITPKLLSNLNKLIEVWLNNNECINFDFGGFSSTLAIMNDALQNCYKNCLIDDKCAPNVTESTTTTKFVEPENDCVHHLEFNDFKNLTMMTIDELEDFCSVEINKTSQNFIKLKTTIMQKLDNNEIKITRIKEKFEAALDASKCQQKLDFYQDEKKVLKDEIAHLKKKLENLQDELEKKYMEGLKKELKEEIMQELKYLQ